MDLRKGTILCRILRNANCSCKKTNRRRGSKLMSLNPKETAVKALEISLNKGCQAARISLNIAKQCSYSVRNDKLDRLQQSTGSSLYIQLYVDSRYGSFSTNRTEADEIGNFIGKGIEATRLLTPDP